MSKGGSRRRLAALANRKRSPEDWFNVPVIAVKVGKNRQIALLPKRRERGRGG